jgi:hypothetical protein
VIFHWPAGRHHHIALRQEKAITKFIQKGDDTNGVCHHQKRDRVFVYDQKGLFLQQRDLPADRRTVQRLQPAGGIFTGLVLHGVSGAIGKMAQR